MDGSLVANGRNVPKPDSTAYPDEAAGLIRLSMTGIRAQEGATVSGKVTVESLLALTKQFGL